MNLVSLKIPAGWHVVRNVFCEIDPTINCSEDELFVNLTGQEDLLMLKFNGYLLDLGWYMGDEGIFGLVLIKGDFHEGMLLEKFISRSYLEVVERINEILKAFEEGEFEEISGVPIMENGSYLDAFEPRLKK